MPPRDSLRTTILQTLINDPELGRYPLAASVAPDYTVQLNGTLPTKEESQTAERLVKSIAGVKRVRNQIRVDAKVAALYPPGGVATANPGGAAAAATTPDAANTPDQILAAAVANALAGHKGMGQVQITVRQGEVRLSGTVLNLQDKTTAQQVAEKAAPGHTVVNELTVHHDEARTVATNPSDRTARPKSGVEYPRIAAATELPHVASPRSRRGIPPAVPPRCREANFGHLASTDHGGERRPTNGRPRGAALQRVAVPPQRARSRMAAKKPSLASAPGSN
ncbi:MAG TPA: BON domain-containing protein [Terriglobales bacterium]|nr:BON domain-containing protein [Terriglobales bacterium]